MTKGNLIAFGSWRSRATNFASFVVFAPAEWMLERLLGTKSAPICFIVGPPRSGTTLLYEMVVTQYICGYLSNFAKRMFRTPVVATFLIRKAIRNRSGAYDSKWGELDGNAAPSEAGRIWRYWMPYAAPYNLDAAGLSKSRIRRKISAISHILGAPMIVKNPILQSDIPALLTLFPDAIFLHIDRSYADNARSLMRLREVRKGEDETGWVSLRPSGWQRYAAADAMTQSCAQVVLSHKDIEVELSKQRAAGRVLRIAYEELCTAPDKTLNGIERFASTHGINMVRKKSAEAPQAMTPRHQANDDVQQQIEACLKSRTFEDASH